MPLPQGLQPMPNVRAFDPQPKTRVMAPVTLKGSTVPSSPPAVYECQDGEQRAFTVYCTGKPFEPADATNGSRFAALYMRVTWMCGNLQFTQIHPANKRVTVVATRVEVTPFIRALPVAGAALAATVQCAATAAIIEGAEGEELRGTLWIPHQQAALASNGQIAPYPSLVRRINGLGPLTLVRAQGFNDGATKRYLMFFDDTHLSPNLVPVIAFPVPAGLTFTEDFEGTGVAFTQGCFWGVSSDPNVFVEDLAATFRVDAEIEAYELNATSPPPGG